MVEIEVAVMVVTFLGRGRGWLVLGSCLASTWGTRPLVLTPWGRRLLLLLLAVDSSSLFIGMKLGAGILTVRYVSTNLEYYSGAYMVNSEQIRTPTDLQVLDIAT